MFRLLCWELSYSGYSDRFQLSCFLALLFQGLPLLSYGVLAGYSKKELRCLAGNAFNGHTVAGVLRSLDSPLTHTAQSRN